MVLRYVWLTSESAINESIIDAAFDNQSFNNVLITDGRLKIDNGAWVDFECYVPISSGGVNHIAVAIDQVFGEGYHDFEIEVYNQEGVTLCKWKGSVKCEVL